MGRPAGPIPEVLDRDLAPLTPTTAPFDEAPCECLMYHAPEPVITEAHHTWPQYDQIRKHGRLIDRTTVSICPTIHRNVHRSIDLQLRGIPHRIRNRYGRRLADYALEKIRSNP